MSIVLLLGAVQGGVVAFGLLRNRTNRPANLLLSGLVFILTLKLIPYVIGYAGFYAAYPWLDLAPFNLSLGIGPLLFLYVRRLTTATLPANWRLHLVPLCLQASIYTLMFVQPISFKNWFEDHLGPSFNQIENLSEIISMTAYLAMTWHEYRTYENGIGNGTSHLAASRLRVLRMGLVLISGTLLAFDGAQVWGLLIHRVSYFQMFPFYLLLTTVVYVFGLNAYHFADLEFAATVPQTFPKEKSLTEIAAAYTARLEDSDFWRDPLLSITTAAKALETSEGRLSRALNSGLDLSFSEWINRYRIDQVAYSLAASSPDQPILEIAIACGFNSKATFNRWFRLIKGCTPTEFRSRCLQAGGHAPSSHPAHPQLPSASE